MVLLYLVGVYINPRFFGGSAGALLGLRDAARYGVMAVGMTFVIVNKDLDLSVGSTLRPHVGGLLDALLAVLFRQRRWSPRSPCAWRSASSSA